MARAKQDVEFTVTKTVTTTVKLFPKAIEAALRNAVSAPADAVVQFSLDYGELDCATVQWTDQ